MGASFPFVIHSKGSTKMMLGRTFARIRDGVTLLLFLTAAYSFCDAVEAPKLVEKENLRGTFHCHTVASDGHNTLEEMAAAV